MNVMKRILTSLMAVLLMSQTVSSFAEEAIIIIISEGPATSEGNKHVNRAPAKPQIEGYYYPFTNSLELVFASNFGVAMVSLENLITGEIQEFAGNTSAGRMMVPVMSNSAYKVEISTDSGRTFYATFFTGIGDEDSGAFHIDLNN